MENRGTRVNTNDAQVMISCLVCGRGVGNNSVQCTSCQKWVHRKCSGIMGSMYRVMKTFVEVA